MTHSALASDASYEDQWKKVSAQINTDFAAAYDGANPKTFVINSKSIAGSVSYYKQNHATRIDKVLTYVFPNWENCKQTACNVVYNDKKAFRDAIIPVITPAATNLVSTGSELTIGEKEIKDNFPNQGLGIGLQLIAILDFLNWDGKIVVYNYGEWTDGAIWLINHGVAADSFDPYVTIDTNSKEDVEYPLAGTGTFL